MDRLSQYLVIVAAIITAEILISLYARLTGRKQEG